MLSSSTAVLNRDVPILDWYLMPEAFSAPLVREAMGEFMGGKHGLVLDPFCGTGTTLVAARLAGYDALGIEVNPFLCFASRVKTREDFDLPLLRREVETLLEEARPVVAGAASESGHCRDAPQMPRLERWISRRVVARVSALQDAIDAHVSPQHQDVPRLALAAILRGVSNMKLSPHAFGSRVVKQDAPVMLAFETRVRKMLADIEWLAGQGSLGRAQVVEADIRSLRTDPRSQVPSRHDPGPAWPLDQADLAITSPPYLNNLDYTMQTRMELFFLDFVRDMDELKHLRKRMLICDAKATYRDIEDWKRVEEVPSIAAVARQIDDKLGDRGWGWDYGRMTRQYFGGMLRALESINDLLAPHAHLVLIVGESAHAGILVPVPDLIAELGQLAGYTHTATRPIRTRRSSSHKIELSESAVVLRRD